MNNIKTFFYSIAALFIASTVVFASLHLRDIATNANLLSALDSVRTTKAPNLTEISAKAIGDLHNHVDKTSLKTFSTVSDTAILSRRETDNLVHQIERPFAVIAIEMLLMFRLFYAAMMSTNRLLPAFSRLG